MKTNVKTLFSIPVLFLFITVKAVAQQWTGSTDLNGTISRNGEIQVNGVVLGRYGGPISGNTNPPIIYSNSSSTEDLLIFGSGSASTLNLRLYDGALKLGSEATANASINNDGSAVFKGSVDIRSVGTGALLHFAMDRPWSFLPDGSGPNTGLLLKSHVADKNFRIVDHDGSVAFAIQSTSGTGYVKGGLGVGTNSPSAKLDIAASGDGVDVLRLSTERPWVFRQEGSGPAANLILKDLSGGKRFMINAYDNTNAFFFEPGNGRSYFKGDMGIGTSITDAKLTVKGDIHAEEVRVDLNVPAPDYVFAEDYDLPSLESISAYIKANQHLPEVPSAEEMEENGIDLGVMNMLLLKKVEELTLYLIKQNQAMSKLKMENQEIKQKLKIGKP